MHAAASGKVGEILVMLDARADVTLRNRRGHTALDMARSKFGVVPWVVEDLLTNGRPADTRAQAWQPSSSSSSHPQAPNGGDVDFGSVFSKYALTMKSNTKGSSASSAESC